MSVRGAAFLGIGAMVGAGIFALLGEAGAVAGAAVWLSFLLAGIVAGLLGYTVVKLGVRFPSSGGLIAYSTEDMRLEPAPSSPAGPPIWVACWGSPAGLRRVARLGDGWFASGYNTTPSRFAACRARLDEELQAAGRSHGAIPNGLATMWLYVSESRRDTDRMLAEVLAPMLGRSIEELRELALPIGSAEQCAERISAYRDAGAERIFVWPLADELDQLERFREDVVPLVPA